MQRFLTVFSLFTFLIFTNSCKDDFELPADYKDIPIVYGILQVGDDNHYIRVEKAFLDPNLSPLQTAKNPDSLYYSNATVELYNMDTEQTFLLERVDAAQEGFVRDEGIFATEPNYVYKIAGNRLNLVGGERIELRINRGENAELVTSQTTILPPMTITKPNIPNITKWTNEIKTDFAWKPESLDASIFDLELTFKYQERLTNDPGAPVEIKSISWIPVRNKTRTDQEVNAKQLNERISGDAFFQFVGESIDETTPAIRIPLGIDLTVYAGSVEIKDFFDISLANAGVTGSQDPPVYSNISGGGRGIFSTKSNAILENITLITEARDSLYRGRFTRDLNFQ